MSGRVRARSRFSDAALGWSVGPAQGGRGAAHRAARASSMTCRRFPGYRFAAILRSPHPHARIVRIDATRARALPGVSGCRHRQRACRLDRPGAERRQGAGSLLPDRDRSGAVCRASRWRSSSPRRRYIAEDACDLIEVEYEVLPAAADLRSRDRPRMPRSIHDKAGSNVVSRRTFRYGDPEAAFAEAARVFELSYSYPRYASTPMETFGVIAHFERAPDRFTVWSNFQGPFVLQPLMAGALRVPGHRLRLITPPSSGGSFGIKQAACPTSFCSRRSAARPACRSSGSRIVPSTSPRLRHRAIASGRLPPPFRRRRAHRVALSQRRQYGSLHPGARARVALPDARGLERLLSGRATSPSRMSSSSPIARRSD